jgi:hypothetical protein
MMTPTPPSTAERPALWNPGAAAGWSLLFSPAFGAYLHARNAAALGREEAAKANRRWFYVSLAYLVFVLGTVFVPAIPEGLFKLASLALLLGWYFSLGKKQVLLVKEMGREGYVRKSWKKPLLSALACLIGAFVLLFMLIMMKEFVFGSR